MSPGCSGAAKTLASAYLFIWDFSDHFACGPRYGNPYACKPWKKPPAAAVILIDRASQQACADAWNNLHPLPETNTEYVVRDED